MGVGECMKTVNCVWVVITAQHDYNDEIRQEQLRELSYLNGSDDSSRGRNVRGRGDEAELPLPLPQAGAPQHHEVPSPDGGPCQGSRRPGASQPPGLEEPQELLDTGLHFCQPHMSRMTTIRGGWLWERGYEVLQRGCTAAERYLSTEPSAQPLPVPPHYT
ncbi:hypothetical protein Z043_109674 [Scleropages formosus]|uniref:Uncharacterized protein n=1 Tax=Scleropages formosus TaxID=113540 RepID=A0A0P7UPH0_SCLFO|nr:hypothetical protein Z043_109674 [Scleropages formosus]